MQIQRAAIVLAWAALAATCPAPSPASAEQPSPKGGSTVLLGLRTAIYHVGDIKQGRDWDAKARGVEPYVDRPFYVGFAVGGFELGLLPDARPAGKEGGGDTYWGVSD